jgi:hypothetical protein
MSACPRDAEPTADSQRARRINAIPTPHRVDSLTTCIPPARVSRAQPKPKCPDPLVRPDSFRCSIICLQAGRARHRDHTGTGMTHNLQYRLFARFLQFPRNDELVQNGVGLLKVEYQVELADLLISTVITRSRQPRLGCLV